MVKFFEYLIVWLHVFYIFNTNIKFHVYWMLFIIRFINLFFMCNFRLQKLKFGYIIDGITINFLSSKNFTNKDNIRRKLVCNQILSVS